MTTTDRFDLTPQDALEIEFLMICRSALSPERAAELDQRIAVQANRIVDERDVPLADAVIEATAQFGAELRERIRTQLVDP